MTIANLTLVRTSGFNRRACAFFFTWAPLWSLRPYHLAMYIWTAMPAPATRVNQIDPNNPSGMKIHIVSIGARDWPALPPTWKMDWAKPLREPEAIWATLDPSGWKAAEPRPTKTTAISTAGYDSAKARRSMPVKVNPMPIGSSAGFGLRSANQPTTGCMMEEVKFMAKEIQPICV